MLTNDPNSGTASNNFVGQNEPKGMRDLLRDPDNRDFRPRADAMELIDAGVAVTTKEGIGVTAGYNGTAPDIGAYEYGDADYWIPGRIVAEASMPVPPNGNRNVKLDADLMWLGGADATSYDVYFGKTQGSPDVDVYATNNANWDENTITGVNDPLKVGALLDTKLDCQPQTYYEFDVTSALPGNGTYTSCVTTDTNVKGLRLQSKEAQLLPSLIVTAK